MSEVISLNKFRKEKFSSREVYVSTLHKPRVYHTDPKCKHLSMASTIINIALPNLRDIHPNVRECEMCKMGDD